MCLICFDIYLSPEFKSNCFVYAIESHFGHINRTGCIQQRLYSELIYPGSSQCDSLQDKSDTPSIYCRYVVRYVLTSGYNQ